MTPIESATEFEIAEQVAALLDNVEPKKRKQILAMLATRYELKLTEPATPAGKGSYRPKPRRGY
jgi:hypothetical protein